MKEHIDKLKYGKLSIGIKNNVITWVKVGNKKIETYIKNQTPTVRISYNIFFPHANTVILSEEYINFYFDFLHGVNLLQNLAPQLGAELASHMYALMTIYWQDLLKQGKYIHGILFWKHILKITLEWEKRNNCHIHKGSLYGYIAFTYLAIGDSYSGFSYLNCALSDDISIGKLCPDLNYPNDAPSNLTISLSSSHNNFMQLFVENVKSYLQSFLKPYKDIHPSFKFNDFDKLFLENNEFLHLKTYFVFCFWAIFDNVNKYEFVYTENSFNKQTNLISLFNLSLILDNVLKYYQTLNNEVFKSPIVMFGDRIKRFVEKNKMNSNYYLLTKAKWENVDLDLCLPELLKKESNIKKKEVNYLLISLLLRNFVAHTIKPQEISYKYYFEIIKSQIYSLIMILRFYNK